jgi:hypothetical protein
MRHFFKDDVLSCFLKIVLKVSKPLYIQSHRIALKAGADHIAIHSGVKISGEVILGF